METAWRDRWQVNKYLWMCLLFVGVYIPFAQAHGRLSVSVPVAYLLFIPAVLNGALRTYSAWRSGGYNDERGWIFSIIDVILISIGVRVTGGIQSDLWLLYFVLLISETLYAPPWQAKLLIGGVAIGYLAATWQAYPAAVDLLGLAARLFFLTLVGNFARRLSADRERRNREVAILSEQVAASEERARIAREIHDGLGHALTAAILRLELCARLLRRDPEEAEKILKEEVPALRAAWNEGRDLAFHLRPWERDEAGFVHGLRRNVSRFAERTGIAVDIRADDENLKLPPEIDLALTRIVQEGLTNIAKHAQASHVTITLQRENNRLHCTICDDGIGFSLEAVKGSFGLDAMRERAEKLGGACVIDSRPSAGTTIEVALPV